VNMNEIVFFNMFQTTLFKHSSQEIKEECMLAPSVESVMKCSMAVALFSRIAVPRLSHGWFKP
jgi:hypothetical protein